MWPARPHPAAFYDHATQPDRRRCPRDRSDPEISKLNKSFGPVHVLKDVDLNIYPGEVTALVGDNGAGKSTIVKCIAGINSIDSGEVRFEGRR